MYRSSLSPNDDELDRTSSQGEGVEVSSATRRLDTLEYAGVSSIHLSTTAHPRNSGATSYDDAGTDGDHRSEY
jgi:hypothetical protein